MPSAEDQPAPDQDRRAAARAARALRLRLEDDGRAGLAAVPRAAARPTRSAAPASPLPGGRGGGGEGENASLTRPSATLSLREKEAGGKQAPTTSPLPEGEGAGVRVPPASPEARAAGRAKEELARQAAARAPADAAAPGSPLPGGRGGGGEGENATLTRPSATLSLREREAEGKPASAGPAVHVPGQTALDFGTPDLENGSDREAALARIAAEVAECTRCPELVANRTLTVPGQGSPYARLVFVGEGPGQEEDRQGLAFVGRAGELLTKMIEAIGMTREAVFIANIIKCRAPGNRQPLPDEAANCAGYLARQLEILRPKVIVALGGTAAQHLLQTHDGITRLRGRFYTYGAAQLMPTFHPAYVLRNYTPDTRKKVYDDLLKVKAALVA